MTRTRSSDTTSATKKKRQRKLKVIEHPLSSSTEFTNREIGWLNFNRRVLFEAEDPRNPILERVRFLGIASSNLDEFFMKRVGGLKRQVAFAVTAKSSDGKTPSQQLQEIRKKVLPMLKDQASCFVKLLKPVLREQNIHICKWAELSAVEKQTAQIYFMKNVFPVLTPFRWILGIRFHLFLTCRLRWG